ncbi:hypothetical protein KCH_28470 [Kitasatospora cheerisanensis KCTC 2395]|uniref:Uncharacterized protein n=1 Tax=Kitasatospora cheerisanensis KCTC 2395 TaxID=1348663 RepID=A0A066Z4K2_9ACTN|nr:hypothetical protein KCH_28470 [Kitasatospora cheerisanensis KCTC 2395]
MPRQAAGEGRGRGAGGVRAGGGAGGAGVVTAAVDRGWGRDGVAA